MSKIDQQKHIIIISGATASGKSHLAMDLAKQMDGAIINADSIQIYNELPILSAQPCPQDKKSVVHFLYGIKKYNEESSVAAWLQMVQNTIAECRKKSKLPIIVGGTGLYISKLTDGINQVPEIDEYIKNQRQYHQTLDREALLNKLYELGDKGENITNLDKQRLIRRLEILWQTGKDLSYWQNQPNRIFYDAKAFIHFNLDLKREILYDNCNKRFGVMLNNGAIEEVENFLKLNPDDHCPAAKTIGYYEIKNYLNSKISKEDLVNIATQRTRNYAKRQLTWFRNQCKDKIVIDPVKTSSLIPILNELQNENL